tara:strand:+ start:949 stop:1479 length:531 start_codon:yes stop_codon:yes gene_type:complete
MKNVNRKLKICLLGNFLLLMFVLALVVIFRDDKSKYLRWGPQDDLIIISVAINDFTRYGMLLFCIMVINISDVLIQEIAMPILGFNIYNPDKKEITEFSKNELQFYGNAMYLINAIKAILLILVNISQIDIALWGVLVSETSSLFTIRMLLNEKTFKKKTDDVELRHNLMDNDDEN